MSTSLLQFLCTSRVYDNKRYTPHLQETDQIRQPPTVTGSIKINTLSVTDTK